MPDIDQEVDKVVEQTITDPKLKRFKELTELIKDGMVTQEDMRFQRNQAVNRHLAWGEKTKELQKEWLKLSEELYPDNPEMRSVEFIRPLGNISPREMKPKIIHEF